MAQLDRDALRNLACRLPVDHLHRPPGAAIAYSIYISAQYAGASLTLSVISGADRCNVFAVSIERTCPPRPVSRSFCTYTGRTLGPLRQLHRRLVLLARTDAVRRRSCF